MTNHPKISDDDAELFEAMKGALAELVDLAKAEGVRIMTLELWSAGKCPGGATITLGPETPKMCALLADAMGKALPAPTRKAVLDAYQKLVNVDDDEDFVFRNGTIAEYALLRQMNEWYLQQAYYYRRLDNTRVGKDCYAAVRAVTGNIDMWMGAPIFLDETLPPDGAALTWKGAE